MKLKNFLTPQHMIVGIAPGKTLAWLEEKCEAAVKGGTSYAEYPGTGRGRNDRCLCQ